MVLPPTENGIAQAVKVRAAAAASDVATATRENFFDMKVLLKLYKKRA